jgi:hypothetical protein
LLLLSVERGAVRAVYNSLRALHAIGLCRDEPACKAYLDRGIVYRAVFSPPTERVAFQPMNAEYNDLKLKIERFDDGRSTTTFGFKI